MRTLKSGGASAARSRRHARSERELDGQPAGEMRIVPHDVWQPARVTSSVIGVAKIVVRYRKLMDLGVALAGERRWAGEDKLQLYSQADIQQVAHRD